MNRDKCKLFLTKCFMTTVNKHRGYLEQNTAKFQHEGVLRARLKSSIWHLEVRLHSSFRLDHWVLGYAFNPIWTGEWLLNLDRSGCGFWFHMSHNYWHSCSGRGVVLQVWLADTGYNGLFHDMSSNMSEWLLTNGGKWSPILITFCCCVKTPWPKAT